MSVKELKFEQGPMKLDVVYSNEKLLLLVSSYVALGGIELDRNQASLLMLYLQEHLK